MEERAPIPQVEDNPAMRRFEMASGGAVASVEYERAGDSPIAPLHAEVPEALSGRGVGSKPVPGVPEALRAEGSQVVPRRGFVAACIERHPEHRNTVADEG